MNLAVKLPPLAPGEFRFTTKALMPAESQDGRRRFRTVASSTIRDMQGDEMKVSALEDMAAAFRKGVPFFLNHKYDAPDMGFGMSDSAQIMDTGERDDRTGSPIYDLHVAGFVDESNPRAIQLHDSISGGMRWGSSVGAIVTKHRKNDVGRYDIEHINVKECSMVGIPINQRSWVQKAANAAESLDDAASVERFDDEDDDAPSVIEAPAITTDKSLDTAEGAALQVQGLAKGKCPTCGEDEKGDCADDYHTKSIDTSADLGDTAKIAGDEPTEPSNDGQEAEVATPEPEGGQEAEGATPEPAADEAGAESEPETAKGYESQDVVTLALHARDLAQAVTERDEEIAALKAERDQLASEVGMANEAITKMLAMPLRRQAVGHVEQLDKALPSFLAPEVKDFLTKNAGDKT